PHHLPSLGWPAPPAHSTVPLHDALPICDRASGSHGELHLPPSALSVDGFGGSADGAGNRLRLPELRGGARRVVDPSHERHPPPRDRKSTRLNSSHVKISYAVFCLKKKKI